MYALVDWLGEDKSSIIKLTCVKTPRKEVSDYRVGEVVKAQCQGFKGEYEAKLIEINDNRKELELLLRLPVLKKGSTGISKKRKNDTPPEAEGTIKRKVLEPVTVKGGLLAAKTLAVKAILAMREKSTDVITNIESAPDRTQAAPADNTDSAPDKTQAAPADNTESAPDKTQATPADNTKSAPDKTQAAPADNTKSAPDKTQAAPADNTKSAPDTTQAAPADNTKSAPDKTQAAPADNTKSAPDTTQAAPADNTESAPDKTTHTPTETIISFSSYIDQSAPGITNASGHAGPVLNNAQTYQREPLYLQSLTNNSNHNSSYYNTDNFQFQQTQHYFDPLLETAHIVQEAHEALYERPAVNNKCQCNHECFNTIQLLNAQVQELRRDVAVLKNQQMNSSMSQLQRNNFSNTNVQQHGQQEKEKCDITFPNASMGELEEVAASSPNLCEAVKQLMKMAFTSAELSSCSVLGQATVKSSNTRQALDPKRRAVVEGLLMKRFDPNLSQLRAKIRDRLKLIRRAHLDFS